jgi:hypothetical protein
MSGEGRKIKQDEQVQEGLEVGGKRALASDLK